MTKALALIEAPVSFWVPYRPGSPIVWPLVYVPMDCRARASVVDPYHETGLEPSPAQVPPLHLEATSSNRSLICKAVFPHLDIYRTNLLPAHQAVGPVRTRQG